MRRSLVTFGTVSLFLLGGGCAQHVDVAHEAAALLAADQAWAHSTETGQPADSIISGWTDDARIAMAGQPIVHGKPAIRQMVHQMMAIPGFHLTWKPDSAVVAASGDLGYTFGTNAVTIPDSTGKASTETGRYITVWRKNASGRWQCVMDYTTPGPAA
jgi:ketosteroid isomerase-like protein